MEIPHELYLQAIKCGSEAARIMTGRPAQKDRLGSWFKKTELTGGRSAGVCLLRYTPPLHNPFMPSIVADLLLTVYTGFAMLRRKCSIYATSTAGRRKGEHGWHFIGRKRR